MNMAKILESCIFITAVELFVWMINMPVIHGMCVRLSLRLLGENRFMFWLFRGIVIQSEGRVNTSCQRMTVSTGYGDGCSGGGDQDGIKATTVGVIKNMW